MPTKIYIDRDGNKYPEIKASPRKNSKINYEVWEKLPNDSLRYDSMHETIESAMARHLQLLSNKSDGGFFMEDSDREIIYDADKAHYVAIGEWFSKKHILLRAGWSWSGRKSMWSTSSNTAAGKVTEFMTDECLRYYQKIMNIISSENIKINENNKINQSEEIMEEKISTIVGKRKRSRSMAPKGTAKLEVISALKELEPFLIKITSQNPLKLKYNQPTNVTTEAIFNQVYELLKQKGLIVNKTGDVVTVSKKPLFQVIENKKSLFEVIE